MTANRIIHHIFNQPDLRHVAQADLEQLVETYPYFAAARLLLAQKQFTDNRDLASTALKKAQLYSSNPQYLYRLLTAPVPAVEEEVVPAAPATTEFSEEELEDAVAQEDQQIQDEIEEKYEAFRYEMQPVDEEEEEEEEDDEVVAVDYETIKAEAEFEAQRTSDEPDEIVTVDYEAEEFEAARTGVLPDDIIAAVDYDELSEREEPPAPQEYEPEIEEEEIIVEGDAAGGGITLPAATEIKQAPSEEGPIRIHPMDTPAEETTLTFQPLYTEDYFAYKKLKDPNSGEMMTEKGQAEMKSFTDWLKQLKDNFAGKATKDWYHQQLHRIYEDDEPEVSERVEKMAMESITLNDDIVSETLAEIWVRQHQHGKAIAVYQKLSLLNPDKNAYVAQKIKELPLLTDNNK